MSDALVKYDGLVSVGGINITNLRFVDDRDALAEEEQELEALMKSLDKTCTRNKKEISVEKTKLMTNSLVISIFLYGCESWTLTAELEKRTQAFEMRCYWRLLNI